MQDHPRKKGAKDDEERGYRKLIAEFLDGLQEKFVTRGQDEADFFDIISRSIDTMQSTITRFQLAAYSPDVIIEIPRNSSSIYEFYRASELIGLGRERAARVMEPYVANR
jgi:NTE family protein